MKFTAKLLLSLGVVLAFDASAIEPKASKDIDLPSLTKETQRTSYEGGFHLVWWVPPEYWAAAVMNDSKVSPDARDALIKATSKHSILAVAQADSSPVSILAYYDRDTIRKGMKIELTEGKNRQLIEPIEEVPKELKLILQLMAPMLESMLGDTGKNVNFFVLSDEAKEGRVISPYVNSTLTVTLTDKKGAPIGPFVIELPLDALFVPRICPNGKPAHVSWVVCPWDGTKLPK